MYIIKSGKVNLSKTFEFKFDEKSFSSKQILTEIHSGHMIGEEVLLDLERLSRIKYFYEAQAFSQDKVTVFQCDPIKFVDNFPLMVKDIQ